MITKIGMFKLFIWQKAAEHWWIGIGARCIQPRSEGTAHASYLDGLVKSIVAFLPLSTPGELPLNENSGGCDMAAVARVLLQHPPMREIVAGLGNNGKWVSNAFLQAGVRHIVWDIACIQCQGSYLPQGKSTHASSFRNQLLLQILLQDYNSLELFRPRIRLKSLKRGLFW